MFDFFDFILFIAILNTLSAPVRAEMGKVYNVCTITINSEDEKKVFQKHLPSKNFRFVELTRWEDDDWFENACQKQIQCDILLISGHFGGSFFGSKGLQLSLDEMEKTSCRKSCPGILEKPKEVYLFGCNTLASKDQDRRTPEQYRAVLIQDGFSVEDAEAISNARYSPAGDSFKDRMRRVFQGHTVLYGFHSVAPTGSKIKPFLENYFRSITDIKSRFEQLEAQSTSLSELPQKQIESVTYNPEFMRALKSTAIAQTTGLSKHNNPIKENLCQLFDDRISRTEKLDIITNSLSGEQGLSFLPTVLNYFQDFDDLNPKRFSATEIAALNRLLQNTNIKETFTDFAYKVNGSPVLQINLFDWFAKVGWFTKEHSELMMNKVVRRIRQQPNRQNVDLLCSLRFRFPFLEPVDDGPSTFSLVGPIRDLWDCFGIGPNLEKQVRKYILQKLKVAKNETEFELLRGAMTSLLGRYKLKPTDIELKGDILFLKSISQFSMEPELIHQIMVTITKMIQTVTPNEANQICHFPSTVLQKIEITKKSFETASGSYQNAVRILLSCIQPAKDLQPLLSDLLKALRKSRKSEDLDLANKIQWNTKIKVTITSQEYLELLLSHDPSLGFDFYDIPNLDDYLLAGIRQRINETIAKPNFEAIRRMCGIVQRVFKNLNNQQAGFVAIDQNRISLQSMTANGSREIIRCLGISDPKFALEVLDQRYRDWLLMDAKQARPRMSADHKNFIGNFTFYLSGELRQTVALIGSQLQEILLDQFTRSKNLEEQEKILSQLLQLNLSSELQTLFEQIFVTNPHGSRNRKLAQEYLTNDQIRITDSKVIEQIFLEMTSANENEARDASALFAQVVLDLKVLNQAIQKLPLFSGEMKMRFLSVLFGPNYPAERFEVSRSETLQLLKSREIPLEIRRILIHRFQNVYTFTADEITEVLYSFETDPAAFEMLDRTLKPLAPNHPEIVKYFRH